MKFLEIIQLITACILILPIVADIDSSEFYTFLRILVFSTSLMTISLNYTKIENDEISKFVVFGALFIGILFNPIFPIYLYEKEIWWVFDIVAAGFFLINALSSK